MPSISAVQFDAVPAVRVMINWSDTPAAAYATVFRIDCETGEETQLRPYVAYSSDGSILLSCGQAVFWDTEVPLDRCVRYCTRAETVLGALIQGPVANLVTDTFTRTLVDSFGSTDNGLSYTLDGGTVPGNYDVNGTKGTFTMDSVNVFRRAFVNAGSATQDVTATFTLPVLPTGASISDALMARRTDNNNMYRAILLITTAGALTLNLNRMAGGVGATIGSVGISDTHTAGDSWTIRLQTWGSTVRAKVWRTTTPEPADWQVTVVDTGLVTGTLAGLESRLEAGNTNGTTTIAWDNFTVVDPCATLTPVQSCSSDLMVGSSGWSMLRDPMRPCNDLHVGICWTPDPNCVPGRGVFFQRLEGEGYAANSIDLRAFNSPRPASASRERSDAASTLVLVSRTFADRDALLEILRAGTPLLWQAPPEYGQPDRYIQIGDVGITRYNEDHRYQPRTFSLPFAVEDRPEGPSQGICGARVMDLCDTYTSWAAMEAAQLSYQDLLLGLASPDGPQDPNRRRWIDVETGFANWLAVETAPNTWKTLRDGE